MNDAPLFASDLLQTLERKVLAGGASTDDVLTRAILRFIGLLDDGGARTWPHWGVALWTAALFGIVRYVGHKKHGVDWYCLVHAWMSAAGSVMVVYLDVFQSERLTGTPEPLRALLCQGPMTSLHRILPAITIGYSLFDFLDGIRISWDFAAHGAVTLFTLGLFCATGTPHFTAPFLIMEVSTVFLVLVRADFLSDRVLFWNQVAFMTSFFFVRCIVSPWLYVKCLRAAWNVTAWQHCYPNVLLPIYAVLGIFFHSLNAYWMYKIILKAKRKLSGREAIRANNDMSDPSSLQHDHHNNANHQQPTKDKAS